MFKCSVCNIIFQYNKSLLRHNREKHRVGFQCYHCKKIFSFKNQLVPHLELHGFISPKKPKCLKKNRAIMICTLCENGFNRYKKYYAHLKQEHGIKLDEEELVFNNLSEFEQWKENQTNLHNIFYVKRTSTKLLANGEWCHYYLCHRSYAPNITTGRRTKYVGSRKIGRCCPSRMKVISNKENRVTVHYTKTHLGHTCDLATIPSSEKQNIAGGLHSGVSFEIILEDSEVTSSTDTSTLYLTDSQDSQNICGGFGINLNSELGSEHVHGDSMFDDQNSSVQSPNRTDDYVLVVQHDDEDSSNDIADFSSQIKEKIKQLNKLSHLLPASLSHDSGTTINRLLNTLLKEMNLQINNKTIFQSLQENAINSEHTNNITQKMVNQQHFQSNFKCKMRKETTGFPSLSNIHSQKSIKSVLNNKPAFSASNTFDHTYYL